MIFSSIYTKDKPERYPKAIQTALQYLRTTDFRKLEPGVYEIQGKDIYAQVMDAQTAPVTDRRPEVHEKFVDVQFLVTGRERLGFAVDTGHYEVDERLEDRDLIFYKSVDQEGFIEAVPGCYSIFFPEDIHRPAVAVEEPETIRKVVVKVSVDLLSLNEK